MDRLRDSDVVLRVWHGPANLHAGPAEVERSGTLFFSFQDLDSTKPAGSVKIRVETITHYLEKYAGAIIEKKKAAMPPGCPLLPAA